MRQSSQSPPNPTCHLRAFEECWQRQPCNCQQEAGASANRANIQQSASWHHTRPLLSILMTIARVPRAIWHAYLLFALVLGVSAQGGLPQKPPEL